MAILTTAERRLLEKKVAEARRAAESGAGLAIEQLGVSAPRPRHDLSADEKLLHGRLRARGRQLGDERQPGTGSQETHHLVEAAAYEHWHRLLYARFLAEGGFLLDPETAVPIALDEIRERAHGISRDWLDLAVEYARPMLLSVFRSNDPILDLRLPPETRQGLEQILVAIPREAFLAEDSLGWVYQFWQGERKTAVNQSEDKIGADEIAPVTQLFTDDYMVLFLLHNTLGAWWTAKRRGENENPGLPGYTWEYLRLNDDGAPVAGSYDAWPHTARELRVLDPCMGSGHFLAFALPILARMRVEEEGLSLEEALVAVLRDNLFGIEIDDRCSQIAAFNLALTAWRLAGRQFPLPALNLACSGLHINTPLADWLKLAHGDERIENSLTALYALFSKAPLWGSLLDPKRFDARLAGPLFGASFEQVRPALEAALAAEAPDHEEQEMAVAARGLLAASRLLTGDYTLVATNVPYLGRGKQSDALKQFCEDHYTAGKADLATCFVIRCLALCRPGGSAAVVVPQTWLFLKTYRELRKNLLTTMQWDFVARLGEHAFESASAAGAFVALVGLTRHPPAAEHAFAAWDASLPPNPNAKGEALRRVALTGLRQSAQVKNPSSIVLNREVTSDPPLREYAHSIEGLSTGDAERFVLRFWEADLDSGVWIAFQRSPQDEREQGRDSVLRWERGRGELCASDGARIQGKEAWGRHGVVVGQMRTLLSCRSAGAAHDKITAVLVPLDADAFPALLAYTQSDQYERDVRILTPKLTASTGSLDSVAFDFPHWREQARSAFPSGPPKLATRTATQWLLNGHPQFSDQSLQVAVARLLGYQWPRQTGSSFLDCPALAPDGLAQHAAGDGIVCLSPLDGQEDAAARLRRLLQAAYGGEWSHELLKRLIGSEMSLEEWLRDKFFAEHCELFHQRPFIWHVWDGLKDGFHALVNYHRLCGANGSGRRTLERLTYSYLGDWLRRQEADVANGVSGAETRLVAAQHLKAELEKILQGEIPYDIFVRWKPLHEQAIGWEPDINDGVRLNIRPWLTAKTYPATKSGIKPRTGNACILRVMPKIRFGVDRGKEPARDAESFPWFAENPGKRDNDIHLTLSGKRAARDLHSRQTHSCHAGEGAS